MDLSVIHSNKKLEALEAEEEQAYLATIDLVRIAHINATSGRTLLNVTDLTIDRWLQ